MSPDNDYKCKECGYLVLYRSDHREACKYGLPVINPEVERYSALYDTDPR